MSKAFLDKANENYVSLEEGATMKEGVRITFMRGFPALYAEALKNICYVKNIPFTRVHHPAMGKDKKTGKDRQKRLYELTSQTSLPVMWYNDERVRSNWTEQLALAERIGTGPKLVPDDMVKRARVFGLIALVAAEDGLIWNSRIQTTPKGGQKYGKLAGKYGYTPETTKLAPKKMIDIITLLCNWLEAQQKAGSKYLVGNSLTAADIYVATMSYMFKAPSPEMMPRNTRTKYIEMGFGNLLPDVEAAIRPIFFEHRDYIIKTHCEYPINTGGDPIE